MNKAEEQYLYWWGKIQAQEIIMRDGYHFRKNPNILIILKEQLLKYTQQGGSPNTHFINGHIDYYKTILRLIENNVITDWPSFVEYMTGETYEKEGVLAMKCTQCGAALNELMVGRCSQPSHEVPIVLCETCCQASPDCINCKAKDCEGYVYEKEKEHE